MRAFAVAWPDPPIVQRVVARLPWRQNFTLLVGRQHDAKGRDMRGFGRRWARVSTNSRLPANSRRRGGKM
jgi:hypothetical protein